MVLTTLEIQQNYKSEHDVSTVPISILILRIALELQPDQRGVEGESERAQVEVVENHRPPVVEAFQQVKPKPECATWNTFEFGEDVINGFRQQAVLFNVPQLQH